MLDEIKEAKAYLSDPQTDAPRIQKKNLTDNYKRNGIKLIGIADFLTIICRHYIFDYCDFNPNESCSDALYNSAIMIMRAWCGFDGDLNEEELSIIKSENKKWFLDYPFAEGWLKKYHSIHLKDAPEWKQYSDEWKAKLNSKLVFKSKAYCYETILANALAQGPLRTYYLMMKPDDIMLTKPTHNKFLKLLSVYMLGRRYNLDQEWVLISKQRILNWMGFDNDNLVSWFPIVEWKNSDLFKKESNNGSLKLWLNSKFIKEFDITLLEQKPKELKEYIVYQDIGHGKENSLKKLNDI